MDSVNRSGKGGAMRLKPHKIWDDEGVASTVGTIMALMVFLAFLSMFTSQYVPVWMEENEASHMSNAYGQFAALKQAVDMQILAGSIQGTSPVQMFSPVKLGAEGIPMFAAPTPGYLSVARTDNYNNVSFMFNDTVTNRTMDYSVAGSIKLDVPNRYYVPQSLTYEGGALILKQPDGEYMRAMPQMTVTRAGDQYAISYILVDLRGDDSNYVGFGTRGVQTALRSLTTTTFNNITGELYLNHTTWHGQAWSAALNSTLSSQGMNWGLDGYTITVDELRTDVFDTFARVSVRINPRAISRLTLSVAIIEVSTAEMGVA